MNSTIQRTRDSESDVLRLTLYDVDRNQAKEVPLRFVEVGGHPRVLYPRNAPPDWVSQATGSTFVRWAVGDREFIGAASATDLGELQIQVMPRFAAKFGEDRMSRWFGSEIGCVTLTESPDGAPYYRAVEALFDESAPKYDRAVRGNPLDLHLRNVALPHLRDLFRPGQRVLELGCGTGLETIPLAQAGVDIVALDISAGMLEQLRRNVRLAGVQERIESRRMPMSDLSELLRDIGPGSFDGAFSHFGALNCEPHLAALPPVLHTLLRRDASVSLGVLNRTCVGEMVGYSIGLRPGRAFARLQSSIPVGRSRFGVPVFPYSPAEMSKLFAPYFQRSTAIGVSVVMPPHNLANRFASHATFVSLLEAGDRLVRDRRFLRFLGDYFLLTMRRV